MRIAMCALPNRFASGVRVFLGITMLMGLAALAVPLAVGQAVTNTNDSGSGSLRAALAAGGTVTFAPSLAGQTIPVGAVLKIERDVTVEGFDGDQRVVLDGGGNDRVLYVAPGVSATLRGLAVENGKAPTRAAGGSGTAYGQPTSYLTGDVTSCVVNRDIDWSNIIFPPTEVVASCDGYDGGGMYVDAGATVVVEDVVMRGNVGGDGLTGVTGSERRRWVGLSRGGYGLPYTRPGRNGGRGGSGGAIFAARGATLTVRESEFIGNSGGSGGDVARATLSEDDCDDFDDDEDMCEAHPLSLAAKGGTGGNGGAIFGASATIAVERSLFEDNEAGPGGRGYNWVGRSTNGQIYTASHRRWGNGGHGGAFAIVAGGAQPGSATVTLSTFTANVSGRPGPDIPGGSEPTDGVGNFTGYGGVGDNLATFSLDALADLTLRNVTVVGGRSGLIYEAQAHAPEDLAYHGFPHFGVGQHMSVYVHGATTISNSVLTSRNGTALVRREVGGDAPLNRSGSLTSRSNYIGSASIVGGSTSRSGEVSGDPRLSGLTGAYGGGVRVFMPQSGSVLIDAGNEGLCEEIDARGFARGATTCDIGAVQTDAAPTPLFVDASATGANDGSTWTDAFTDLRDALAAVEFNGSIWVAGGVYYPTQVGSGQFDQTKSFAFPDRHVKLYGGFAGTETALDERDWRANTTVLSGDIGRDDVNDDGNFIAESVADIPNAISPISGQQGYYNSQHVVRMDGLARVPLGGEAYWESVLDGFTVTAGASRNAGAGILVQGSGAGNESSPRLRNLVVSGNGATQGGGVYIGGADGGAASPAFTNVLFQGNGAHPIVSQRDSYGGHVYVDGAGGSASPAFVQAVFTGVDWRVDAETGPLFYADGAGGTAETTMTHVTMTGGGTDAVVTSGAGARTTLQNSLLAFTEVEDVSGGQTVAQSSRINHFGGVGGTFEPGPGSDLIDAGDDALTPESLTEDFLGRQRVRFGGVDIGAVESLDPAPRPCDAAPVPLGDGDTYVVYVDAAASGANDGSSWEDAFTSFRDGTRCMSFGEVWVAEGVYTPTNSEAFADASFSMRSTGRIYGGFAGGETARDQRDPAANLTILSGDIARDDLYENGDGITARASDQRGRNSYHVLTAEDLSGSPEDDPLATTARIEGVVITAGNADGEGLNGRGGGLLVRNNAPLAPAASFSGARLSEILFAGNAAREGGAFYAEASGPGQGFFGSDAEPAGFTPTFVNTIFAGNAASERGGAVYVRGFVGSAADGEVEGVVLPRFINVTMAGNAAGVSGGAIYATSPSGATVPTLSNAIVWGNTAPEHAGIHVEREGEGEAAAVIAASNVQGRPYAADPAFADPEAGDYRLTQFSSAVQFGDASALPSGVTTDFAGAPRIQGGRLDLGAYEYDGALPTRRYVSASAEAGGHGGSWDAPFRSLQSALLRVTSGDVVFVAEGTYYPDEGPRSTEGARSSAFVVPSGVQVVGGFSAACASEASGCAEPDESDPSSHVTLLSGDLGQDDEPFAMSAAHHRGGNASHVVTLPEAAGVLLRGLSVTGGRADGPASGAPVVSRGGGIYAFGDAPAFEQLRVYGNHAGYGGGIAVQGTTITGSETAATFTDITVEGNAASQGAGGIAVWRTNAELRGATIRSNAGQYGGGLALTTGDVTVENTTFASNRAIEGGGIFADGLVTLRNATLASNAASGSGGAVHMQSNGADLTVQSATFASNRAGSSGGALSASAFNGTGTVTNSIFWDNMAGNSATNHFDLNGASIALDYSVVSGGVGGLNVTGGEGLRFSDPSLTALADNGGAVPTMLLGEDSAAIDTGVCEGQPETDARGQARGYDAEDRGYPNVTSACDIGAVEAQEGEVLGARIRRYHVRAGAPEGGDGLTWASAFGSLQTGIDAARPEDRVFVAAGTYYPDPSTAASYSERTARFVLRGGTQLVGGFRADCADDAGDCDEASDARPGTHLTILSGDLDRDDEPFDPTADSDDDAGTRPQTDHHRGANAHHVVDASAAISGAPARLRGFAITGGRADVNGQNGIGGGVFAYEGFAELEAVTLYGNYAKHGGAVGVYAQNAYEAGVVLRNVTVSGNVSASYGGGVYISSARLEAHSVTVTGNATGFGGAVSIGPSGDAALTNTILFGNVGFDGAASGQAYQFYIDQFTGTPRAKARLSHSLITRVGEDGTCPEGVTCSALLYRDPLLMPLAANGAVGFVHQPGKSSPVVDAGTCSGAPPEDARGFARPYDADDELFPNATGGEGPVGCDIGAVEAQESEVIQPGDVTNYYYVNASIAEPGDGRSWATALRTVQDALAVVVAADTVLIAAGTYYPDEGAGQTNDDALSTFALVDGAVLMGGFRADCAGEASDCDRASDARPWEHTTVLSGDIQQNDDAFDGGVDHIQGRNAYRVLTATRLAEGTALHGVTITSGYANRQRDIYGPPGPTIETGGGVFVSGGVLALEQVRIVGNRAQANGGGMAVDGGAQLILRGVRFESNASQLGGALDVAGGHVVIEGSLFEGNEASSSGGALYVAQAFDESLGDFRASSVDVRASAFVGNTADSEGGGVQFRGEGTSRFTDVTFTENIGRRGSGAASVAFGHHVFLTNTTIAGNAAEGPYGSKVGGGVGVISAEVTMTNSVVWGNRAGTGAQIHRGSSSAFLVSHSIVQGGLGDTGFATAVTNVLTADPLLGALRYDLGPVPVMLLGAESAAIDAGSCDGASATDARGAARPYDVPRIANAVSACDMGAVEAQRSETLGTFAITVALAAEGAPAEGVTVDLLDASGTVVQSAPVVGGTARFEGVSGYAAVRPAHSTAHFAPSQIAFSTLLRDETALFYARATAAQSVSRVEAVATVSPSEATTTGLDEVEGLSGGSLQFPAGAVTDAVDIQIGVFTELPPGAPVTGTVLFLGPTGTTFAEPVTLRLPVPDPLPEGVTNAAELSIIRYDEVADTFETLPTMVDGGFLVAQTFRFSGYSVGTEAALPVELSEFEAALDGASALLTWTTASETNNAGFAIERRLVESFDEGQFADADFSEIGWVDGAGTSVEARAYALGTPPLAPGRHVFRLRQVDFDGAQSYSPEVEVTVLVARVLRLDAPYPNPTSSRARLGLTVPRAGHARASLYDALGRRLAVLLDGSVEPGRMHHIEVAASELAPGAYFVRVQFDGEQRLQKVIVSR